MAADLAYTGDYHSPRVSRRTRDRIAEIIAAAIAENQSTAAHRAAWLVWEMLEDEREAAGAQWPYGEP